MKGNKKLLIVAVLLLLVAVSYTTYAIYRTNFEGEAQITAATWSAVLKKDVNGTVTDLSNTFTLTGDDFVCTGNHAKVAGKIAPGDTCTATLVADLDGSEVDAKVGVTLTTTGVNDRFTVSLKDGSDAAVNGEVAVPYSATAGGMEKTFKVVIAWDGTDAATPNATDTDTLAGADITIPVTITAHQNMN